MRQMPNFRYTARGRPHIRHLRRRRVENFGGCNALARFDLLATGFDPVLITFSHGGRLLHHSHKPHNYVSGILPTASRFQLTYYSAADPQAGQSEN